MSDLPKIGRPGPPPRNPVWTPGMVLSLIVVGGPALAISTSVGVLLSHLALKL